VLSLRLRRCATASVPAGRHCHCQCRCGGGGRVVTAVGVGERLVTVLLTLAVPEVADPEDSAALVADAAATTALEVWHAVGVRSPNDRLRDGDCGCASCGPHHRTRVTEGRRGKTGAPHQMAAPSASNASRSRISSRIARRS